MDLITNRIYTMYQKKQARDKNMSVRITAREKNEFEMLANEHNTSVSNWAYNILVKHKDSYGKVENIDQLIGGIELTIEGLIFTHDELSKIKNTGDFMYSKKNADFESLKTKFLIEILKFKKLQKEIKDLKK